MKSRLDRYSESENSRTSKNRNLYKDLYKDTNYTNSVVIDDSSEIDIDKIKKIIDSENKSTRQLNNTDFYNTLKNIYKIDEEETPKKSYDINQVLKEAKNKRDIIEEANEKRKIENYKFKNNLDLESELAKTRRVYNDLVKEETELLNIMNTLTNINTQANMDQTTSMAFDLLEDLNDDKPKQEVIKKDNENTKTITVKKVEDDSKEYSTDTFMFDTRDFDSLKNVTDQIKKSNGLIKVLIFIFTVLVIVGCYFFITKMS